MPSKKYILNESPEKKVLRDEYNKSYYIRNTEKICEKKLCISCNKYISHVNMLKHEKTNNHKNKENKRIIKNK